MYSRLLYRRQFILSSQKLAHFDSWTLLELSHGFTLFAHPDLELTETRHNKIRLIVLGFIIDRFSPGSSNQNILDKLITDVKSFKDVITGVEIYSGRWIIIYQDSQTTNILHDPCGQRQIYYHLNQNNISCASDTSLINHFFNPEPDASFELRQFMESDSFRNNENKWVGNDTIYQNVKHLMPNHYLNLLTKEAIRYWPVEPLKPLELNKGALLASEIIKGSLIAAGQRKSLALAVTAGMDSRILLAASKDIKDEVTYYVSIHGPEYNDIPDFTIPYKLLKQLDLPFYAQKCYNSIPKEFKEIYKKNITASRLNLFKSNIIYQNFLDFQDKMIVNGNACEIARTIPYCRPLLYRKPTVRNLARVILNSPKIPYVESKIRSWLKETDKLCSQNHINIFDMLNWEQRLGNWGALYPAEQDISVDQFSPFNNRKLLCMMMSVDLKYRIFPNYIFFKKIIEILWPETLSQPFNPKKLKSSIRIWGRHSLLKFSNGY